MQHIVAYKIAKIVFIDDLVYTGNWTIVCGLFCTHSVDKYQMHL